MSSSDRARVRLVVSGRVQGVGFRRFVERSARRHGVAGWVRNRSDGSVEILAEGPPPALELLRGEVRQGPPGARVLDLQATAESPEAPLPEPFAIHPG